MPKILPVLVFIVGAAAASDRKTTVLPPWPPTYVLNASTILMACSYPGFLNLTNVARFAIIDLDWSNAKQLWANAHPMTCEEALVEQAAAIKAVNPAARVWVYRNNAKALPWFSSVRTKLADPAFAGFFLPFKPGGSLPNGTYYVDPCDWNYDPPRCSGLYHDQVQSPEHPAAERPEDGNCTAAPCDCGAVPCGEYIWSHTNGSDFQSWFISEHIMGPTGLGNPNISGFYFDDGWSDHGPDPSDPWCSGSPIGGPTETDPHCVDDMGLVAADTAAEAAALSATNAAVRDAVLGAGGFAWSYLVQGGLAPKSAGPAACEAWFRETAPGLADVPLYYPWSCPWCGPSEHDSRTQDLAAFLLVRGPYAWIGSGWAGSCDGFMADPYWPPALDADAGTPLTPYFNETAPGVFNRSWTGVAVGFDCTSWEGSLAWH